MNNKVDRPTRIEFQLSSIRMPSSPVKNVGRNYAQFNNEIMDWGSFGGKLKNNGLLKSIPASGASLDELQKANRIYKWLSKNVTWNEVYSMTGPNAGREVIRKKKGSVGDMNLTFGSHVKRSWFASRSCNFKYKRAWFSASGLSKL